MTYGGFSAFDTLMNWQPLYVIRFWRLVWRLHFSSAIDEFVFVVSSVADDTAQLEIGLESNVVMKSYCR